MIFKRTGIHPMLGTPNHSWTPEELRKARRYDHTVAHISVILAVILVIPCWWVVYSTGGEIVAHLDEIGCLSPIVNPPLDTEVDQQSESVAAATDCGDVGAAAYKQGWCMAKGTCH